jgi:hypothetical protein
MKGLQKLRILDDKRHNPAVGSQYGRTPLGRLLVVGMSHYGDEGDVRWPGFTHMIVGEVIEGKRKIPYFTKIAKLFRDDNGDAYSVKEFYPAVAFYNFLPDHFKRPRQMTTQEQCKHPEAQRFLFKVIDELRPDHLIVTSENLWRLFPRFHPDDPKVSRVSEDSSGLRVQFNSVERECFWYLRADGGHCLVGAITHPSAAKFNSVREELVEWIADFIAKGKS